MPKFLTMDDFDFKGKTVLVRVDFNSAIDPETKKILDDTRIRAHGETTIKELVEKGAKVVILAHQGRKGKPDFIPLKQHAEILSKILGQEVKYVDDVYGEKAKNAIRGLKEGDVLVLENVRTLPEETAKKSPEEHAESEFVKNLAPLADVFINDAFAAAHRSHASIVGFTVPLPTVAGRIMERELKALDRVLRGADRPCIYILGGAKADDSLAITRHVLDHDIADYVLTGGLVGHLFLAARGINLGDANMKLLEEMKLTPLIPGIKDVMKEYPDKIKTPLDVAVEVDGKRKEILVENLPTEYPIYDIGRKTIDSYVGIIGKAKSIVVSGPLGLFEKEEFSIGTREILTAVAEADAYSLVGGGHTVAATHEYGLADKMSYVSTAGGALIAYLMGEELPGVVTLEKGAKK